MQPVIKDAITILVLVRNSAYWKTAKGVSVNFGVSTAHPTRTEIYHEQMKRIASYRQIHSQVQIPPTN